MCDRWRNDFAAFLADMGPKPSPDHTVDRINPDGHYEPGNCRWATPAEQAHTKRQPVRTVEINGETLTIAEWSAHRHPADHDQEPDQTRDERREDHRSQ